MTKQKSISKEILIISIPVILQNLVNYLLIFTDTLFIGRYKIEGLSAINNVVAPYFMLFSFFIALAQGLTIVLSQTIGAKKYKQFNRIAEISLFYNQILSLIYFFIWSILGTNILKIVGAKGEVLNLASEYVRILAFVYIVSGISITISAIFQGMGKTKPTMYASIIKTLLNIILNWLLIFGVGIFPEMGVAGAALGTVISEFVSAIILIVLIKKEKQVNLRIRGIFKANWKVYQKVIRVGVPVGIEFMLWTFGNAVLIYLLNQIDESAAGYFGILNTLVHLSLNIYLGFGVASLVLIGRYKGAGDHEAIIAVSKKSIIFAMGTCSVIGLFFLIYPEFVIGLFTKDKEVVIYLSSYIFFIVAIMFPKAGNVMVGSFIRGTGDTKWMMYTQLIGTIVHIILALILVIYFKLGFKGILIAILIDELWRSLANYGKFYLSQKKRLRY